MKKLEKILWGIFIIGILFKIMKWPGAGIFTTTSLGVVACFYLYLGIGIFNNLTVKAMFYKDSYQYENRFNLLFGAIFGIVLAILVIGFLFKFMLWPGANVLLILGLFSLLFSLLIYGSLHKKKKVSLTKPSFYRIALIGILSLSLFIIQSDSIIDFYYPNNPEYAKALKEIIQNPSDIKAQQQFDSIREQLYSNQLNNE